MIQAVEDDSATENTPSLSLHSFSEEEKVRETFFEILFIVLM
jgi:hypothetical protein